jgi:uroporphyrinogen decarboxylase
MTSRERILTALAHREPDRIPYDLGGIGPSGISQGAYEKLLIYCGIDEKPEPGDLSGQRANPGESFLQKFRVDTRPLAIRPPRHWQLRVQEKDGYFLYFDEWGLGRKMSQSGGKNFFLFHHPLSQVETKALPGYPWPDPVDPDRLKGLEQRASDLREKAHPALVLGGPFSQGLLQFAAQLEGYDRFFMNLILEPRRAEWLLDKLLELKLRGYLWALERLRGWVDVVSESDDLGHQHSQWVSPEMFRKFVKSRYTELFSTLKKRFGVKILFHSCGAVYPFIPDLIEMGVEALNPIQLGAAGMGDTRRLKKEFGDTLTFWGGGIDVQQTLPTASPQEVEDEIKRRIDDLAPGGGFVFAATQTIQPDTPPENVMAMWRALQRQGVYPVAPPS